MNLKVTNLIAIQFGMFVGVMSWLAYSGSPFTARRVATEVKESALNAGATVTAVTERTNPHPNPVDDRSDRERPQQVDEQLPHWMQSYYQSISPQRYAQRAVEDRSMAVQSSSHAEIREPAVVSPDYAATQPIVVYEQPAPVVVYAEPIQQVVFSDSRHFRNRCRPVHRARGPQANPRLSLNLLSSGPSGNVLSRANTVQPVCRPVQRPRPQGIVRQGPRNR